MERDREGWSERLLDDAPRRSIGTGGGWTREWRFFIWTWTIESDSDDWLVETVQRRFLGEEVVHRYSRTLWILGALACLVCIPILSVVFGGIIYMSLSDPAIDKYFVALAGLSILPVIFIAAAIVYFTFVPPKEYRLTRGG